MVGVNISRWEGGFLEGGFVAVVYFFWWCGRIGRCGGCGGGEGAAPRGGMVDGVKREQLREGRQLGTMGSGVGGCRVRPRRAGRKYLLCQKLFVLILRFTQKVHNANKILLCTYIREWQNFCTARCYGLRTWEVVRKRPPPKKINSRE